MRHASSHSATGSSSNSSLLALGFLLLVGEALCLHARRIGKIGSQLQTHSQVLQRRIEARNPVADLCSVVVGHSEPRVQCNRPGKVGLGVLKVDESVLAEAAVVVGLHN